MRRILSITVEGKGGVGKSTTTGLVVLALRGDKQRVVDIYDADTTNSMTRAMHPEAKMLNLAETTAAGEIVATFRSDAEAIVIDTGARDEARLLKILPTIVSRAKNARTTIVAVRPITTSSYAQTNAAYWVEATAPLGVKTILVKIVAQGRSEEDFEDWDDSTGRHRALELGAVEMIMTDAGVRYADEAAAFGLSFGDIALGEFSRVEKESLPDVLKVFTPAVQEHFGMWIETNAQSYLDALAALEIQW